MPKPYDHHVKSAQGPAARHAARTAQVPDLSRRLPSPDFAEVEVDGRVRRVYGEPEAVGQVRRSLQEAVGQVRRSLQEQGNSLFETAPGGAPAMQNRFPVSYGTPQIRMEMPGGGVVTRGGSAYAEYDPGDFIRYNDPERAYLRRTEGQGMVPYYGIDVNDPGNRRRMSLEHTRSGTPEVRKDPIPQGPPLPWEPGGRGYEHSRTLAEFDRVMGQAPAPGYSADPGLVESPYPELRGQGLKTLSEWNALKRQQDWISRTQAQSPLARTYGNYFANLANMTGIPQMTPGGELEADPYHMDPAARWGAWMAAPAMLLAPELAAGKWNSLAPVVRNPWMEGLTATNWAGKSPFHYLAADALDMGASSVNPFLSFNKFQNRNLTGIWDAAKGMASGGMNLGGRAMGVNAFTSGAAEGLADARYHDRNNPLATDADFLRLTAQGMFRPMSFAPGLLQAAGIPAMFGNRGEELAQRVAQQGGVPLPGTDLVVPMTSENLQAIAERGASHYQRLMAEVMGAAAPFSGRSGPREQRDLDAYAASVEQGRNDFAMGLARQANSDPAGVVEALRNPGIGPRVRAEIAQSLSTSPMVVEWLRQNHPEVLEAAGYSSQGQRPAGAN